jgi:hypothetical protein
VTGRRLCAVSITGTKKVKQGTETMMRLRFYDGESREEIESIATLDFVTDHRGYEILGVLIEPVPTKRQLAEGQSNG